METIVLVMIAGLVIFALALTYKDEVDARVNPLPAPETIPVYEPYKSIHTMGNENLLRFIDSGKIKDRFIYKYAIMEAGRRGLL